MIFPSMKKTVAGLGSRKSSGTSSSREGILEYAAPFDRDRADVDDMSVDLLARGPAAEPPEALDEQNLLDPSPRDEPSAVMPPAPAPMTIAS